METKAEYMSLVKISAPVGPMQNILTYREIIGLSNLAVVWADKRSTKDCQQYTHFDSISGIPQQSKTIIDCIIIE